MTRRSRNLLIAFLLLAAIAIVVAGGFLWPRPQFERGPWATPAESAPSRTP